MIRCLALLILGVLYPALGLAQCCKVDHTLLFLAANFPNEPELECYSDQNWCDSRHQIFSEMLSAQKNSDQHSINQLFASLDLEAKEIDRLDSDDLLLIFYFASVQSNFGNNALAAKYFKIIKEAAQEEDPIHTLALIQILKQFSTTEGISTSSYDLEKRINAIADPSIKGIAMIYYMPILRKEKNIEYSEKRIEFYKYIIDPKIRFLFLSIFGSNLHNPKPELLIEVKNELMRENKLHLSNEFSLWRWLALSKVATRQKDYEKAVDSAKKGVEECYGQFDSIEELIGLYSESEKSSCYKILQSFANAKLFLTRAGYGIETVKESFSISESICEKRQLNKLSKSESLNSTGKGSIDADFTNILIIGTYLYQKTGEIDYLNRAITMLEIMTGGSTQNWLKRRETMRDDARFRHLVEAETEAINHFSKIDDNYSLSATIDYQNELEQVKVRLKEGYSEVIDSDRKEYTVDLNNLQERLATDSSSLVSFYYAGLGLYRLYVNKDTTDIQLLNDVRRSIDDLSGRIIKLSSQAREKEKLARVSRELYQLLFRGIDSLLSPKMNIIATGALEQVPYSILRKDKTGENPRYLGIEHAISRQYSINTMQRLQQLDLRPKRTGILGLAPTFNNELLEASELRQAGFALPPLLYNQEELHHLEALGNGRFEYAGRATLDRYRERAPQYSIIHLATHALSSETDGLRSRVYLLDNEGEPTPLYAGEIGYETLNADLVTLSACETGGGGQNVVEGTIGLTKAYIAAGARAVVASSWAVDDRATSEFMQSFYTHLRAEKTPDVALQLARRAYVTAHPNAHPSRWAAFEAYGGMVAPAWNDAGGWPGQIWYYFGALFALLLGGFAFKKMRYA